MAIKNLRRLKVENFRSFAEAQEVFFTAETKYFADDNKDLIPVGGSKESILPVTVLYGANAAGKSNFLRVFDALSALLKRKNCEKNIFPQYEPFDAERPCSMEVEFVIQDSIYLYVIKYVAKAILEESLSVFGKNGKLVRLYSVKNGKVNISAAADLSAFSKSEIKDWLKTRNDVTVLEILGVKNVEPYSSVYLFLKYSNKGNLKKKLYEDEGLRKRVLSFIKKIDVGIEDIIVEKEDEAKIFARFHVEAKEKESLREFLKEEFAYKLKFKHSGIKDLISFSDESDGTIEYLKLITSYLPAFIETGGVFVNDEIEESLHPLLVRQIIQMFHDKRINKAGAQLVCSTHDVGLMQPDLLRRDEIWFVEKDPENGSSEIYPLSQFTDVRKTSDFGKDYIKGKFGAIPFLGNIDNLAQLLKNGEK